MLKAKLYLSLSAFMTIKDMDTIRYLVFFVFVFLLTCVYSGKIVCFPDIIKTIMLVAFYFLDAV